MRKKESEKLPIEIQFVPLNKEELETRQNKLMLLLFKGAKKVVLEKGKELHIDRG